MQVRVLLRLRQAVHDGRALRPQRVLLQAGPARAPPAQLPVLPARQGAARAANTVAGDGSEVYQTKNDREVSSGILSTINHFDQTNLSLII